MSLPVTVRMSRIALRKAAELEAQGFIAVGYTFEKAGERSAVMFDSAVAWLTDPERRAVMFVDGRVIVAPLSEELNRQAFERYAKSRGYRIEKRRGNYLYAAAQSAWEVWKAAQASMTKGDGS